MDRMDYLSLSVILLDLKQGLHWMEERVVDLGQEPIIQWKHSMGSSMEVIVLLEVKRDWDQAV